MSQAVDSAPRSKLKRAAGGRVRHRLDPALACVRDDGPHHLLRRPAITGRLAHDLDVIGALLKAALDPGWDLCWVGHHSVVRRDELRVHTIRADEGHAGRQQTDALGFFQLPHESRGPHGHVETERHAIVGEALEVLMRAYVDV